MPTEGHEELAKLVAAYALDALDAQERRVMEEHVASCQACAEELADFRKALASNDLPEVQPPATLWPAILTSIRTPESGEAEGVFATPAAHRPLAVRRLALTMAFGALLGVGYLAGSVRTADTDPSLAAAAHRAAESSGALIVSLASSSGEPLAQAILLPDGVGHLRATKLPPLAGGTYQLWGVTDGRPVSLGLLGTRPDVVSFRYASNFGTLAITAEADRRGNTQPSATMVAAAAMPA